MNGDCATDAHKIKGTPRAGMKRESVIDPVIERPLLGLHAAMNLGSLWKAIQQLLAAAIPNRLIGLMLQPNPILPMIARWTLPMPDGFFTAAPLKNYIAAQPRQRFVQISELFSNRSSLVKSAFYRRYMAPQKCAHAVCLLFWQGDSRICERQSIRNSSVRSVWRSRIFLSSAKICGATLLSVLDRQARVCRSSSGSPGANRKLRDWSAKDGATRKSLMTPV